MDTAVELLNLILAKSHPGETIRLPLHLAEVLAKLDERELGRPLSEAILQIGVVRALEQEGLFSRKVVVTNDDTTYDISKTEP